MAKQYLCLTDRVQVGTKLYRAGEIASFPKGTLEFDKDGKHPHWENYDDFLKREQERAAAQLTSTDSLENEIADLKTQLEDAKTAPVETKSVKDLKAEVKQLKADNEELVKAKGELEAELELINEMTADNTKG